MPNLGFLWRLVRPIVRRYPLILIVLIVVGAVAALSVKQIDFPVPGGRFERTSRRGADGHHAPACVERTIDGVSGLRWHVV